MNEVSFVVSPLPGSEEGFTSRHYGLLAMQAGHVPVHKLTFTLGLR